MGVLVLTYHGVEAADGPLFVDPELFRLHADCVVESGATSLTIGQLAEALETDTLPEHAVAITFDDGLASVANTAAPLLLERGLTATVFCVAGYLGRRSDWPTHRAGAPIRPLSGAQDLEELVRGGIEIGSHGMEHAPLVGHDRARLRREIVDSRHELEQVVGVAVPSFAFPYGAGPSESARSLVSETYSAACSAKLGYVRRAADLWSLPRVDAHYVRRPRRLRAALEGSLTTYLAVRRLAARARRTVRKDYELVPGE